ncbi:MAG: MBL fold metallo-hydrolase [Aldersonia sp.]|nr:MBL fold metallo-hydrolase [Aldersonia sp.]
MRRPLSASGTVHGVNIGKRARPRRFRNTEPSITVANAYTLPSAAIAGRTRGRPRRAVPLAAAPVPARPGELAVTWYGHASTLIEIEGHRILADPMWGHRASPSALVGPARLHPVPVGLESLPPVDAVVISHDHYDHLDKPTIRSLLHTQDAPFLVPTGVGAHLRGWGVPVERIVELDWGKSTSVGELTVTCTEARHFSGRGLIRNTTLWASWVINGRRRRAYFGGDTGYGAFFADIADRHGPFELTVLPIGAYDAHWPNIHMTPEQAVTAHTELCGGDASRGVLVPMHWATFNLALHPWDEPIRRLVAAAAEAGTTVAVPRPGERVELPNPGPVEQWWADIS